MQTALTVSIRHTTQGQEADRILRSCVHCGFCNATCPTYQLLGDELDGPRGRIYQIKQLLEGEAVTRNTVTHLDRCLTCRSCETTCPSGVEYARLLEIGREIIELRSLRSSWQRVCRWLLRQIIPYRNRFASLLRLGQILRLLLPHDLEKTIPRYQTPQTWPLNQHPRRMLLLQGCVQPALAPGINLAAVQLLERFGISCIAVANEVCCGAASQHTSGQAEALLFARGNIDAWWPYVEQGIEAIVSTASGCGVQVKDYAHLLRDDPVYAARAQRIAALTRDISEIVVDEDFANIKPLHKRQTRVAFQSPCTLQHGQRLTGTVEKILLGLDYQLTEIPEAHLCCGSAGTYSLLQPALATQLRQRKLAALQANTPEVILTANIGCLMHLQAVSVTPVQHWVEFVAQSGLS